MKRALQFTMVLIGTLIIETPCTVSASPMVTVDHVDGLTSMGFVPNGATLVFHIRLSNDADVQYAISNGFRIFGEGYNWTAVDGQWNPNYNWNIGYGEPFVFDWGPFVNVMSTGTNADTIGFAGLSGEFGTGLLSGFDDIAYTIAVGPITCGTGPLVLDSSFWYPANYWLWGPYSYQGDVGWGGPYEYMPSCCVHAGDVDHNGQVDVMDVVFFVEWIWSRGPEIPCPEEADVDGSGQLDVMDIVYFVEWLWQGGPALIGCQ